jgi:hypothetical protein
MPKYLKELDSGFHRNDAKRYIVPYLTPIFTDGLIDIISPHFLCSKTDFDLSILSPIVEMTEPVHIT